MSAEVIHGDCLDVMRNMPDGSVDLIAADLPYGTTACKWDAVIPFDALWREYRRLLKPSGAVVLTASQPFTSALVMSNPSAFRCEWIWRKNAGSNFATVKWQPMKEHESVLVFAWETPTYHPIMQPRSEAGTAMIRSGVRSIARGGDYAYGNAHAGYDNSTRDPALRVPSSVQMFNRERGLHPTQKPVALMEYMVRTYSDQGALVLDNTCGSGTTGVACVQTGRRFIGIEREAAYVEIARKRIADAQAQLTLSVA